MIIETIPPTKPLQDYIKCYWTLQYHGAPHTERLFPVGEPQIIFHLSDPFVETNALGQRSKQPGASVCGQLTVFKSVTTESHSELFGIALKPHALRTLLKVPAYTITDQSLALEYIDKKFLELHMRIQEAKHTRQRVNIIERYLLGNTMHSNPRNDKFIHDCLKRMDQWDLTTPIPDLLPGVGRRQLERIFLEHVGVSARSFQKINRFTRALKLISSSASLTSIGYESGYFDQAHFSRSFKDFTGYSPKDYRQKLRAQA